MISQYTRHPISARYPDIGGQAYEDLVENMKEIGFLPNYPIILHEGQILDGWQRYRACLELDLEPTFKNLVRGADPEHFVYTVNEHRRHESEDMMERRIRARRERIVKARQEGKSLRQIAEEEQISHTQVGRELEEEATVTDVTVEPEEVVGRDGKKRKARTGPRPSPSANGKTHVPDPPEEAPVDVNGVEIPKSCRDVYFDPFKQLAIETIGTIEATIRTGRFADGMTKRHKRFPWYDAKQFAEGVSQVMTTLDTLITHLKEQEPTCVCPRCLGKKCERCRESGLVPKHVYKQIKTEMKEEKKAAKEGAK